MNQIHKPFRWAWSLLVVGTLAFAMSGCEGDDGSDGADGSNGSQGPEGPEGPAGPAGPEGPGTDPVEQAIADANVESCSVCHEGAGGYHQAVYNEGYDTSDFVLAINNIDSFGDGPPFTVEISFSITYMGEAFDVDPTSDAWVDGLSFRPSHWDGEAEMFQMVGSSFPSISGPITNNGGGSYTLTATNVAYDMDVWDSGAVVGTLTDNEISFPDGPTSHFHVYDDLSADAYEVGMGSLTTDWGSLANVEGCEACHGAPYRKHANVQASVPGAPDFTYCKSCHFDDRTGGHFEWQQMADAPLDWANKVAPDPDKYAYVADVMNVTHMSHAMDFPYPMSMSNCVTCHDGNIAEITDDSFFTPKTCKSCHVVDGVDAWPSGDNTGAAGPYAQAHKAPPLEYLWAEAQVEAFHDPGMETCTQCHGPGGFSSFADHHSGYDKTVYDNAGNRYTDLVTIAIDDVTIAGDLITVDFTSTDATVNPTLAISFYGWDSKHYIIPAHDRDGNRTDDACLGGRSDGCNIEWEPGSTKPFFTEDAASVAGDWRVTFDMSGYQAYKTDPIPQLIADGVVKMAEITVMPELELADGTEVNIDAVSTTFDLGGSMIMDEYFQGDASTVDIDKCALCHENTGVLVHTGGGRYGDSMQVCKVCHNPTYDGSHMEMQSRSIDSYVHAIHAFQPFDEADVYNFEDPATEPDPVDVARNELHKSHTFPNFTMLSCEGCHKAGTYEVPSQALSMPGAQSASDSYDDPNHRKIGTIPMTVTGAAGRGCGSCHRAYMIKADAAGDLAAFDAHTAGFGTFVEDAPLDADEDGLEEEPVLFGIIDKIMSMFE